MVGGHFTLRIRLTVKVVLALLLLALPAGAADTSAVGRRCTLTAKLVPTCNVLQGALVAPTASSPAAAFLGFENLVGAHQDIVSYYHQGAELFPTQWEMDLARQPGAHRLLLLNWKPEDGKTWAQVAAGESDEYIDREAQYLKAHFPERFFLAIHHEPEEEVIEAPSSGYTSEDYSAMYRHVVDRLRQAGVDNAVFVMQYMGAQTYALRPWFESLWPGDQYVDWVAFDSYQTEVLNGQTGGFARMMNLQWGHQWPGAYDWMLSHHPGKPIMLAEWGLSEKPGDPGWKAWLYRSVSQEVRRYPALKAMVYFNYKVPEGNVVVNTTPQSLRAFRDLAGDPIYRVRVP